MAYAETTLYQKQGGKIEAVRRRSFAYAEDLTVVVAASTSTAVMVIDASGLKDRSFQYVNNASQSHVVSIFGTNNATMPTTQGSTDWKQTGSSATVTAASSSEFQVFDNPYTWLMLKVVNAAGVSVAADVRAFFQAGIEQV